MSLTSQCQTVLSSDSTVNVSQRYRQALQPYVEPEMLELANYQFSSPKVIEVQPSVVAKKHSYRQVMLMLVATALCLFGATHHQNAGLVAGLSSFNINPVVVK